MQEKEAMLTKSNVKQLQSCVNDNQLLRQQIHVKDNELAELQQKVLSYRAITQCTIKTRQNFP